MLLNTLEIVWNNILIESKLLLKSEPKLTKFIYMTILQHKNFKDALIYVISQKLSTEYINTTEIIKIFTEIYHYDINIIISAAHDIYKIRLHDPSVNKYLTPFLYLKGFHALQIHRISHWLWNHNHKDLAMYFYNHITTIYNVDIHPAANIGHSIILDHATGIVIGETTLIENNVSIMQSVTLGSTGKNTGDRHPKIRQEVMIGAGSIILGNIEIGIGAKIGAGSVVIHSVPPYSTVTGKPAKLVEKKIISTFIKNFK